MAMDRRERGVETRKRSREKTSAGPSSSITYDFLRFLFGPKTTLFDNLTPSLHFHPTFPFPSLLHSIVSHEFPSRTPLLYLNDGKQVYACIFLCATNLCILEGIESLRLGSCWLRPYPSILLRYPFAHLYVLFDEWSVTIDGVGERHDGF